MFAKCSDVFDLLCSYVHVNVKVGGMVDVLDCSEQVLGNGVHGRS